MALDFVHLLGTLFNVLWSVILPSALGLEKLIYFLSILGTIYWANIGRCVFGASNETLMALTGKENPQNLGKDMSMREFLTRGKKDIEVHLSDIIANGLDGKLIESSSFPDIRTV